MPEKNGLTITDIKQQAAAMGFSAAYCFSPREEDGVPAEVKTLVLLPYAYTGGGRLVDAFYKAKNTARNGALKLCDWAQTRGEQAWMLSNVRLKAVCARLPAFASGLNTLCYLEGIGSRFCLELVGLSAQVREEMPARAALPCKTCGRCMRACPTGAITTEGFIKEKCLRFYMLNGKPIPEEYRGLIGAAGGSKGIVGCDVCQRACPENEQDAYDAGDVFSLEELLACSDETLGRFGELYGRNYAIRNRILAQAALAAGNSQDGRYLPMLLQLCDSPSPTVMEHARWAVQKLKNSQIIY